MKTFAVVLASGRGERFGRDKCTEMLGNRPVWRWSFDQFCLHEDVSGVGVVASSENIETISTEATSAQFVVLGGESRAASAALGVRATPEDCDIVLIHDAARPFVSSQTISRVISAAQTSKTAAPIVELTDTIREGDKVIDRSKVRAMQTPQAVRKAEYLGAHLEDFTPTDDVAVMLKAGCDVAWVEGDAENFKITTQADFDRAQMKVQSETRTGFGYDIHSFSTEESRPLMLGGVFFPDHPALDGHSDADVLLHAVVDAMLGAANLGDIGEHFPNTDNRWQGEPSVTFLRQASLMLKERGWRVGNIDVTVIAESPKIGKESGKIKQVMGQALDMSPDRISIKATTNERLGSIGRGEGISAMAVATIFR